MPNLLSTCATRFILWLALSISAVAQAGTPLWTYTPLTPTTLTVSSTGIATVQYTLTNQSKRQHILNFSAIPGVVQNIAAGSCPNPVILNAHQSCTLTFNVTGSALSGNTAGGLSSVKQGIAYSATNPARIIF